MRTFLNSLLAAFVLASGLALSLPGQAADVTWYRNPSLVKQLPPEVSRLADDAAELMNQSKWAEAKDKLDQALKLRADVASLHQWRGTCHYFLGKFEEALSDMNRALELEPAMAPVIYLDRAELYTQLQQLEKAVEEYTRALKLTQAPEARARVLLERGRLQVDLGEEALAIADFMEVVKRKPQRAQAYSELAYLAIQHQDARACFDFTGRAIKADPKFVSGWLNRSTCELAVGKTREALNDLNVAARLAPDMAEVFVNRAAAHDVLGQCREALADAERATALEPQLGQTVRQLTAKCRKAQPREM